MAAPSSAYDPARCGRIAGLVTWSGAIPRVEEFLYGMPKGDGNFDSRMIANPNQPHVELESRALADAIVFLRGIDPALARPWDLPPVRVEMKDLQVLVGQGNSGPRRVGFVRRGDPVEMVAAEPVFHILRGRGAAFFSFAFPDPDRPLNRSFADAGRISLSSGAGFYWASADLFVDDHPYYAITGPNGRFELDRVPEGDVDLVVWLPGWVPAGHERDPETGLVVRMTFAPPTEIVRRVRVSPRSTIEVDVAVGGQ